MFVLITVAIVTAILTSVLTCFCFYLVYRKVILPELDHRMDDLRKIASDLEENIAKGVKKGMKDSIREIPSHTIRETTQNFSKVGSELIEGGISALFRDAAKGSKR